MKKTAGRAPAAGRVVRRGVGGGIVRGSSERVMTTSHEVKGVAGSGDPKAPHFRRLNNADPGPKNGKA